MLMKLLRSKLVAMHASTTVKKMTNYCATAASTIEMAGNHQTVT